MDHENSGKITSPYTKFSTNPADSKKKKLNELEKMKEVISNEAAQNSKIVEKNKKSK